MFGLSFSELVVIGIVTLLAVGPNKLPGMLRSLGLWVRKARLFATDLRRQSGIDEVLRSEGLHQSLRELRGIGGRAPFIPPYAPPVTPPSVPPSRRDDDPYLNADLDLTREYPPEGPDAYHTIADDLMDEEPAPEVTVSEQAALEPARGQTALEPPGEGALGAPVAEPSALEAPRSPAGAEPAAEPRTAATGTDR